jgi:hypothetical protein
MLNNHRQPVDRTKLLIKLRELEEEWRAFARTQSPAGAGKLLYAGANRANIRIRAGRPRQ